MAELRYTYLLDVKDRASRAVTTANERIARSTQQANRAMERQGAVAQSASRQVQTAGARQAAEWKQVARAAQTAERSVAQSATQASTTVSKALERQVAAQRKAGASYAQIARQQRASGTSARETAAAIEQSAAREQKAMTASSGAARKHSGVLGGLRSQLKGFGGMAAGLGATFAAFKGLDFLRESVNDVEDLARATIKLQAITGQDAKTASSWLQVAKQRGISTRQLSMAFITLEKNQVKAAAGSKTQAAAFKALGITQEQLRRSNPQQLIERVADGMKRLGPGAQRAAAAQQLLGRGGQLLIATLSGGSQKLRDQLQLVQKYGAALNEKGVRNAAKLVAEQRKLDLAMLGLKVTVGQAIIPYLTKGGQALSRFVAQMRSGTGTGGQVRKVLEQVGSAAKALATSLGPVAKVLAQAFGPAARVAGTAIRGMTQIIRGLVGVVKGVVGVVTNLIRGDFAGAWRSVKGIVRSALSGLGGLVKTLMAPVYTFAASAVRKAVGAVGRLGGGIVGAIRGAIGGVAKAAAAVGSAIWGGFKGTVNRIVSLFRSAFNAVKSIINSIKSAAGSVTSLPGKILDAVNPFGRRGGVMHSDGFRRYQAGGVVPAMVSPGEMIVHGNAGMVVPGPPVAADTVPMLLPTGSAVLTGHGQQLLAQGATISQAVAAQAPHFAKGGFVKVGATVYNDPPPGAYGGSLSMGYAELGTARRTDGGGTGRGWLARALGRRGELPENYPLRVSRRPDGAGRVAILRKRDRGYGQGGDGRTSDPYYAIDIWRDAWSNLGINGSFKGPVWVQPTTGKLPASTPGTGGGARSVSGLAQAMSRRVGRSVKRAGLVDDAFGSGFAQGEAGLTRQRLRYRPDTAARDIAAAYRLPASKTVSVPGAKATASASGAGNYGGARGPMVTWEGKRMRSWLAHALAYARDKGWRGSVNQGLRSHAEQVRLWNGAPGNGLVRGVSVARPGQSRHESGNAVDVSPPGPGLLRYFRGYRGMRPKWMGERDRVHYSDTGHRKGGWIGGVRPIALRAGTGSVGGPVQVGRVIRQETTGPGIPAYGRRLQDAVERALTWQAGTFEKLNTAVQAAAERKLGALRNRLQAAVRKGGTEATVKRLQAALDLVDKELGRRAGLLARRVTQRAASADRAQARSEIGLRLAGVDPESAPGLAARLRVEAAKGKGLHRTARDLDGELRLARRAHDLERIADLKTQIADNQTAILESRASQKELARARQQAMRDARTAFAASLTDIASSRVSLAQTGLQRVELEQRLAGTYDTGGRARADYITQSVIPQLQAERDQIKAQGVEAMRQNNAELARAMRQAWEEKGNDILQALLDVKDATSQTATNTDPLKSLGGQLAFEFGGSRLTDDLAASGVGA